MGEVEEVQEQMKANIEALKEQMATMMEAMMSMKKIMKANTVAFATTSIVANVNPIPPSGLNQMNRPTSAMIWEVRVAPMACLPTYTTQCGAHSQ